MTAPGERVRVREIRPADHERVASLLVAAYRDSGPFTEDYLQFLGDPGIWVPGTTRVFVAERTDADEGAGNGGAPPDRHVVGVVAFTLPGDDEFETTPEPVADSGFRFLAVDPGARGIGAGRALVRACIDAARRHGARRMVIHSMYFMTAAHRLYEQEGFVRRPDLDVLFPTGTGVAFHYDLTGDAAEHFPRPGPVPDEPPWFEDVLDI